MKKNEIILICFWLILLYGSFLTPQMRVGGDLPFAGSSIIQSGWTIPISWSNLSGEGFGFSTVPLLWGWPFNLLFALGAIVQLSFSNLILIFAIIPTVFLGVISMFKLLSYYRIQGWGRVAGIIFYLSNTYILLLIDGGQLSVALSYALLPLAFISFIQMIKVFDIRKIILSVLPIIVISALDIRFIFVLFILIFLYMVFELAWVEKKIATFFKFFGLAVCTLGFLILFHFYWIYPALILGSVVAPAGFGQTAQIDQLSFATLGHAFLFQQPHWPENVFGRVSSLKIEFLLLPVLAFAGLFLKKADKTVAFWSICALIAIFFIKGANPPFGGIYPWMFTHIPGFIFFRDPTKFYFLLAVSYSVLIGIGINELMKLLSKNGKHLLLIFVVVYLLFLNRPIFFGQMTGFFSEAFYGYSFGQVMDYLSSQNSSKVFWVKRSNPIWRPDTNHPIVDSSTVQQKRPFMIGIKGDYDTLNFLREATFMGEIFDVSGIGYIVYPPLDSRRDSIKTDNLDYFRIFLNQLEGLTWIEGKQNIASIPVLKVKNFQEILYSSRNLLFVVGEDKSLYEESTKSANLRLKNNSLFFAEEGIGGINNIDQFPEANILLHDKELLDLKASFIPASNIFSPASILKKDPDETGWWKREAGDLLWWRNFLINKYGIDNVDFDYQKGWAVAEGGQELTVPIQVKKDDFLLARVLESSRSGKISFWQNNQLIGEIQTKSRTDNFKWNIIGLPVSDQPIRIITEGDINVINVLANVDQKNWDAINKKVSLLQSHNRIISRFGDKMASGSAKIDFKQLNQTKYIVKVSDLTSPQTLVFSQNYNYLWKLDGHSGVPLFSFVNGFRIDHNGEYVLEFQPQKNVEQGFVVSSLFWTTLMVYLVYYGYYGRKKIKTKIF